MPRFFPPVRVEYGRLGTASLRMKLHESGPKPSGRHDQSHASVIRAGRSFLEGENLAVGSYGEINKTCQSIESALGVSTRPEA